MKKTRRSIAAIIALVILAGMLPSFPIFSATPPSPFLSTMYTDDNCIKDDSASITSTETFGDGAISLYGATITSTGKRKSGASAQQTFNMKIAMGSSEGRLFVYSKAPSSGQGFANYSIKDIAASTTINKTNFKLAQSNSTYTFTPKATAFASGYEAVYAYKKLGYTVEAGKKYTYCFKLATITSKKYTSFLFGELPSNTTTSKMLNNFAVIGGAFSNNGDSGYSDVRVGKGRVQLNTSDVEGKNQNVNLYLETSGSYKYSYYRIDINGLNYTVKAKNASGTWTQIGDTYTLPTGTQLIMGCASWEANIQRAMSVKDPAIVDITNLSSNISKAKALTEEEYTPESWAAISPALTKAEYSVKLTYQKLVDYANTQLDTAINGLVKRLDLANANIAEYEATDKRLYTSASWEAYQDAYEQIVAAKESGDLSALDAPNAAYAEAKAGLVLVSISVEITWQTMHFTYTVTNQQWDPQTHDYTRGDEATWAANDNSNVIEITNNSTASVDVGFAFEAADGFDDISGQFYKDDALIENNILTMAEGTSESVTFNVTGSIPSSITDDSKGGTVTVSVSRS